MVKKSAFRGTPRFAGNSSRSYLPILFLTPCSCTVLRPQMLATFRWRVLSTVGTCAIAHDDDVCRWTQHAYAFRHQESLQLLQTVEAAAEAANFAELHRNGSSLVWYYVSFSASILVSDSVCSLPCRVVVVVDYYYYLFPRNALRFYCSLAASLELTRKQVTPNCRCIGAIDSLFM